jgi:hypothetical protein
MQKSFTGFDYDPRLNNYGNPSSLGHNEQMLQNLSFQRKNSNPKNFNQNLDFPPNSYGNNNNSSVPLFHNNSPNSRLMG